MSSAAIVSIANVKTAGADTSAKSGATLQQDADNDCQVCCSTLNKSSNKPILCPFSSCGFSACVSCVRKYLIGNPLSQAHCMSCKKHFNLLFLVQKLSKLWVYNIYKPQIFNVLVDIQISKLAESMPEAEKRKKIADLKQELSILHDEKKQLFSGSRMYAYMKLEFDDKIKYCVIEKKEDDIKKEIATLSTLKERKIFTVPCSYNDCKGMLSMQYNCGLCNRSTCKDCREPRSEDEHKCNPDNVSTRQAILKETRPCPSCNTRIYKIEGCDQMWCTSCKTPFSWTTGNKVPTSERIHNPHAIDFFKQNGAPVRAPGDLICGGLIPRIQYLKIEDEINNKMSTWFYSLASSSNLYGVNEVFASHFPTINMQLPSLHANFPCSNNMFYVLRWNLFTVYTIVQEASMNKLRESREVSQGHNDFNEERVRFILNDIDRKGFISKIKKYNNEKNLQLELSFIWEIISNFGIDMFNALYNARVCNDISSCVAFFCFVFQKLDEFSSLIRYANSQFAIISNSMNCFAPIVNYMFTSKRPLFCNIDPKPNADRWIIYSPYNDKHLLLFDSIKYKKSSMKNFDIVL
jgi:hypothetical protein